MTIAAGSWILRTATTLLGLWCAANITIFRPALRRLLPGETFVYFPAGYGVLLLAFFASSLRSRGTGRDLRGAVLLVSLFAAASIPTSVLQTAGADFERLSAIVFVSLQILLLAVVLPELLSSRDYVRTLQVLTALFLVGSLFLYAVNLLNLSHALGEQLPRMNERGGLFRRGIVFHRNPNAYIFQWMPAVLLVLTLRVTPRWRALPLAGFLIVFVQLMLSCSRGATLVVLLSLSPAVWRFYRLDARRFWAAASLAAAALAVGVWRSPALASYLMLGLNLTDRDRIWTDHLEHLWSSGSTLWGVGYFNYWMRDWWGPHNAYLAVLVFYGVFGLVTYGAVLMHFALRVWTGLRPRLEELDVQLLLALLAGTLLWGLVEDSLSGPLTMPAFYFWLVAGMLLREAREPGEPSRDAR
jgi:hypothetical protein